ncbi:uncharacterized protein LOC124937087 [Impatiens glandulifera]|uniref:uncharacterized protein LOC124937087 n=1 Tax=Impatiens glandulifera TaxID=253017 RepID=UPI001FB10CB1|nr:uncharacterized protein LOC124937087 [Impatiens glandulifera]
MESSFKKTTTANEKGEELKKPPFRRAKDDTKPVLRDPILTSDPLETEEAVLQLPPFPSSIQIKRQSK